jgi:NADH-quinone oxidoreductase subunit F
MIKAMKAIIPGGVSAPWFGPEHARSRPSVKTRSREKGSMLGSGSIVVIDETTCVVRAAWRITKFFSRESCGQCTPCREGSGWIERAMYRLEHGGGREEDLALVLDLVRQHRAGSFVATATDHDLRVGFLDTILGALGDTDVPR